MFTSKKIRVWLDGSIFLGAIMIAIDSLKAQLNDFHTQLNKGGSLTCLNSRLIAIPPVTTGDKIKTLVKSLFHKCPPVCLPIFEIVEGIRTVLLTAEVSGLSEKFAIQIQTLKKYRDVFILSHQNIHGFDRKIPRNILVDCLSEILSTRDIAALSITSKMMRRKAMPALYRRAVSTIMLGELNWKKSLGLEIDFVPKIPKRIHDKIHILMAENTIEGFNLVLIPAGISFNCVEKNLKNAGGNVPTWYNKHDNKIRPLFENEKLKDSYWVLMQKEFIVSCFRSSIAVRDEDYESPTPLEIMALECLNSAMNRYYLIQNNVKFILNERGAIKGFVVVKHLKATNVPALYQIVSLASVLR